MLDASDLGGDAFLRRLAMAAASQIIRWGDMSRLRTLLLGSKLWDPVDTLFFFRLLMEHWADFAQWRDIWELAFGLVNGVVDTLVQDRCGNELLCLAARWGCMPIVHRLVAMSHHHTELKRELLYGTHRERHLPSPAEWIHQSIGDSVLEDRIDDVEYLLQEDGIEAHISHINSRSENVLHLTSKFCHPAVFRLLIPHLRTALASDTTREIHPLCESPRVSLPQRIVMCRRVYCSPVGMGLRSVILIFRANNTLCYEQI